MLYSKRDIETITYTFLNNIFTDVVVTPERQEDWRDSEQEYCLYRVGVFQDISQPKYELQDNEDETYTLIQKVVQNVEVTVDLVGDDAFDNYNLLKRELFNDDHSFKDYAGLVDYEETGIDNTAVEKGFWKQRVTGGFTLQLENEFTRDVETIEDIDVDYTII